MKTRIFTVLTALLLLAAMCATAAADLPATFDWRNVNGTNYVTPAKYQDIIINGHTCGACAAFALMGAIESNILISTSGEKVVDLSEQVLVSDCFGYGDCDYGIPLPEAVTYCRVVGIPSETCFPYTEFDGPCDRCDCWESDAWYLTSASSCSYNVELMKARIYNNGPIISGWTEGSLVDHAVLIIGWDDNDGVWIYKDSKGPDYADNGCSTYPFTNRADQVSAVYGAYQKPAARYDIDNNCEISISEMGAALDDWYADIISISELGEVLDAWHAGSYC